MPTGRIGIFHLINGLGFSEKIAANHAGEGGLVDHRLIFVNKSNDNPCLMF